MAHSGRRLTIFSPHYSISIRTPRRCPARAWQRSPTRLGSQRCCVWPEAAKTIPQGGFTLQGRLHCCAACWITLSWVWGREERWRCQLPFFFQFFSFIFSIPPPLNQLKFHSAPSFFSIFSSFMLASFHYTRQPFASALLVLAPGRKRYFEPLHQVLQRSYVRVAITAVFVEGLLLHGRRQIYIATD